ncbi:lamin tail domain-containing protein, partial [Oscillochloris sp. ZM17-4]|uniref:lamin tail domain-containing protein n=1 Tax=Oscillochloris sp. ZM17-4 TaxID=2866714 RepID=UPI001C736C79|nr:lamin tail domain-containing protein [Oscillochloris sp. ZM17-4]
MRRLATFGIIIALLGLAAATHTTARAGERTVQINEFMPDPSAGEEWAELYNNGSSPVDIGGWQIDDESIGKPGVVIAQGTTIAPGAHMTFAWAANILNKAGDTIQLLGPAGDAIDSHTYGEAQSDLSLARIPDGGVDWLWGEPTMGGANSPAPTATISASDEAPTETATGSADVGTPTAEGTPATSPTRTSTPTATPTNTTTHTATPTAPPSFGSIRINEIAAGTDPEWIEIYNSGDRAVSLDGWRVVRVSESSGTSRSISATVIGPGEFVVVSFAKGFLPNDGATIVVHDGAESPMSDSISYPALDATHVYALQESGIWEVTDLWSQGEQNPPPPPTATSSPSP